MGTRTNLRKSLAIAFMVALLAGACGSNESTVSSDNEPEQAVDETTESEEPSADAGPPDGFRRFTFEFAPVDVIEDVYKGDLTTFEVRTASGSETVVIGFLDDTGTIDIPIELAQGTIGVEAELPVDKFCWWSGFHTTINAERVVTVEVELDEVCA